jgi:hypothetical protein
MTTPEEFYTNVVTTLNYLDSGVLPMGSHIVLVGVRNKFNELNLI